MCHQCVLVIILSLGGDSFHDGIYFLHTEGENDEKERVVWQSESCEESEEGVQAELDQVIIR